jgi:hypothetical protein
MKLEGLIDEDLEYDEWISHSDTWLALGQCLFLSVLCYRARQIPVCSLWLCWMSVRLAWRGAEM